MWSPNNADLRLGFLALLSVISPLAIIFLTLTLYYLSRHVQKLRVSLFAGPRLFQLTPQC